MPLMSKQDIGSRRQSTSKPTSSKKRPPQKGIKIAKKSLAILGKALLTIFLVGVITGCIVVGALAVYVMTNVKPDNIVLSKENLDYTTFVYSADSQQIAQLHGTQNRVWVDLNKIPLELQNAFICTEDMRFYEHDGVDWKRTSGAALNFFVHYNSSSYGGSTITQQLIKNVTGKNNPSPVRKIQEIITALDLEKKYSKDQILESYLNTIPFNNAYGVEAAAQYYYDKDVWDLDLAQSAMLAGIINAPSYYDPFTHYDRAKTRQETVILKDMLDQKKITKAEYLKAKAEDVKPKRGATQTQQAAVQSYFVDMVVKDVVNDLVSQKGYTKDYAMSLIYNKGLRIYTTEDKRIQDIMDSVYTSDNKNYWKPLPGTVQPQSGMMIVDYTGQIKGVEGGRGQKTGSLTLNRATDSLRQPGSSIKPLAVYGPGIMYDKITWSTIEKDQYAMQVPDPKTKQMVGWPNNDNGAPSNSLMTVQKALAKSINAVAANITVNQLDNGHVGFDFMKKKLGFTSLVTDRKQANGDRVSDRGYWISIGAITDGVSVREMAGGYEIFGNNGVYTPPYSYTKVTDSEGNILLENKPASVQAMDAASANITGKLLQAAIQDPNGTAHYLTSTNFGGMPIGGKTGTTDEEKDRWFMGITPYYVGAVWVGYDQPKKIPGYEQDLNPAAVAWRSIMSQVMQGLPKKDFPTTPGIIQQSYDPSTGLIVPAGTPGSLVGWYKKNVMPQPSPYVSSSAVSSSSDVSSSQASSSTSSSTSTSPSSSSSSTGSSSSTSSKSGGILGGLFP